MRARVLGAGTRSQRARGPRAPPSYRGQLANEPLGPSFTPWLQGGWVHRQGTGRPQNPAKALKGTYAALGSKEKVGSASVLLAGMGSAGLTFLVPSKRRPGVQLSLVPPSPSEQPHQASLAAILSHRLPAHPPTGIYLITLDFSSSVTQHGFFYRKSPSLSSLPLKPTPGSHTLAVLSVSDAFS